MKASEVVLVLVLVLDRTELDLKLSLLVVVVVVLSRANTNAKTNERAIFPTNELRTTTSLTKSTRKRVPLNYTPTTRLLQFFPATLGTISPYP